ncbi:rare lipoprotein A [Pasteurella langaaensis DSM 22999]|uniref:Endolytic peptidoglycan transglycosylase RlpA n=1 Tax=Alitibacter langaaensis DSM 22999 TaxID=1122935 RepID=A0A2U0TGS4_9PAST|nr:septal ring lytic transglycosylase RlpA family protein [Pasteurella langaaensis]PVX42734.1 rare lipoprotein A [Pasteurella langaaensis DSM 22999]
MTKLKRFLTALFALYLTACTSHAEAKKTTNRPTVTHTQALTRLESNTYSADGKTFTTQPRQKANHYEKKGQASYYHNKFNGRRTASGEIYRSNKLTAAHRTLPLGSYVLVTNTRNNRKVVVKINDRGPFHSSRIIDLSKAAASELGMVANGTGYVKVEKLYLARN